MKRIPWFVLALTLGSILLTAKTGFSQYAFAAKQITLNGYDFLADSYDSTDPNRSTGGVYDALKAGDQANIASEAGILNSVGVGTVLIWGKLSTAQAYSLEMGPGSSIGSLAWHQTGQYGIEPGFQDSNFAFRFPGVVLPSVGWQSPEGGTWEGEEFTYILADGDFIVPSLNLAGNEKLLVAGSAQLFVRDEFNLKGSAAIRILPSASLKMYVGAATANIRGTGILNEGSVSHFQYYGLAANNTVNLRFTASFSGLIYAPQAVCYLTTKGNAAAEWSGAFVVQELDLGAPVRLHYDEALLR